MIAPKTLRKKITLDAREIGQRIRSARLKRGWRQCDLGQAVGMATQTVACWETGVRIPETRTLAKVACHLRRKTDWLLFGNATPKSGSTLNKFLVAPFTAIPVCRGGNSPATGR